MNELKLAALVFAAVLNWDENGIWGRDIQRKRRAILESMELPVAVCLRGCQPGGFCPYLLSGKRTDVLSAVCRSFIYLSVVGSRGS